MPIFPALECPLHKIKVAFHLLVVFISFVIPTAASPAGVNLPFFAVS